MDAKSRRQRYTRQWKCARRSLAERSIRERLKCNTKTPQQVQDPNNFTERNDHDRHTRSAFECGEIGVSGVSDETCSSGKESVEHTTSEENCNSGHEGGSNAVSEENCRSGPEDVEMPPASLTMFLQEWSMKHLIPHNAIDDLLRGLKQHGHPELPLTARTLLRTPRQIETVKMSGMECVHFNLRESLIEQLKHYPKEMTEQTGTLEISFNIDGLPIFKSSRVHLWPILCAIHLTPTRVFPVTLTLGPSKPTNLDFIEKAIGDIQELIENGLEGKQITIRCVVCDAPARAMVKRIKQYSGYYGCDKCTQKGRWISGRVTYPQVDNLILHTNETYRAEMTRRQQNDDIPMSPFLRLPLDMIDQFPIDYMHQACLGVMKKLITEWIRGDRKVRMSAGQTQAVSQRLLSLKAAIPSCFPRKPRGLEDIDRWKATELRQFAVYTGKIVLKGILSDQLYDHFMGFSVALSLLLSPSLAVDYNSYTSELMNYFVTKTKDLYGEQFMVYNIHAMTHLPAEALRFGSLDACSAFPFENFLGKLKRLVRSGKQPLVQVAKRLMEISVSPQTTSVLATKCKLSRPNNAFILGQEKCCEAIEERTELNETGSPVVLCKVFEKCEPLFEDPCDSRILGCYKVQARQYTMKLVPEQQLTRPAIMLEEAQEIIFLAILHTI